MLDQSMSRKEVGDCAVYSCEGGGLRVFGGFRAGWIGYRGGGVGGGDGGF